MRQEEPSIDRTESPFAPPVCKFSFDDRFCFIAKQFPHMSPAVCPVQSFSRPVEPQESVSVPCQPLLPPQPPLDSKATAAAPTRVWEQQLLANARWVDVEPTAASARVHAVALCSANRTRVVSRSTEWLLKV